MSKENLHFDGRSKQVYMYFLFCIAALKEIENLFFMFLLSYTNTHESLGELEKAVKHSPAARVPTAFLILPNFTRVSIT